MFPAQAHLYKLRIGVEVALVRDLVADHLVTAEDRTGSTKAGQTRQVSSSRQAHQMTRCLHLEDIMARQMGVVSRDHNVHKSRDGS